jgi:hypothetical protein
LAKLEQVIKAELNPLLPVPEIMTVIEALVKMNQGHEISILTSVAENVERALKFYEQKGDAANAEPLRNHNGNKPHQ